MAHRHEHLCSTSQLWLPHPALCVVLPECFQDLCVWSRAMGSKSGKLWNIVDHDSHANDICFTHIKAHTVHLHLMVHQCLINKLMMLHPWLIIAHPLSHSLLFQHFHWTTFLSGAHWWDLLRIMCSNSLPPISHNRCRIVYFSTLTNTCQALMLLSLPPFLMNGPMLAIPLPFSCMCSQGNYPQEGYWWVGGCYLPVNVSLDVMQLNLCIISSSSVWHLRTFNDPHWLMCIKSLWPCCTRCLCIFTIKYWMLFLHYCHWLHWSGLMDQIHGF